jgi:tRNA(adenine34) deaminase
MKLALEEAEKAERHGEVPIGAVLAYEGQVLGRGHNSVITLHDPTAHAEVQALRAAGAYVHNYRMTGSTLYVTLEPCLMCFGALVHARVERVVYAASDPKVGVTRWSQSLQGATLNHRFGLEGGLLADESRALIQAFFKARRGR